MWGLDVCRGKVSFARWSSASVGLTTVCGSMGSFEQEWLKPGPSRRPDIFPEFTPIKPPLPQPMPGDPEEPEEDEDEEGEGDPENPDEQEPPPEEE